MMEVPKSRWHAVEWVCAKSMSAALSQALSPKVSVQHWSRMCAWQARILAFPTLITKLHVDWPATAKGTVGSVMPLCPAVRWR